MQCKFGLICMSWGKVKITLKIIHAFCIQQITGLSLWVDLTYLSFRKHKKNIDAEVAITKGLYYLCG